MANRVKTQTTQIKIGDGAGPEVFTKIPAVDSITGLGAGASADIEVTDFDSTGKEYVPGLKDEGTINISLVYDPDDLQHIALEEARDDQDVVNFKIVASDGTTFSFAAAVKTFEKSFEKDNVIRGSVQLRVSGGVVKS